MASQNQFQVDEELAVMPSEIEKMEVFEKQNDIPLEDSEITEPPYSVYNRKEKWLIVGLVAVAGLFRYLFIT